MASTPIVLLLLILLLSGGAILLGGLLMKRGFWPKRRGTEPQCCGCGYSLIGLVSQKCPECGAVFSPQNILYGRRPRKTGTGWTGLVMILIGLAVLTPAMLANNSQIDWYHFTPAFLVMRDLRSSVPTTANQAIIELDRRDQAGDLARRYQQQLLQMALVQQATNSATSVDTKLIELFERHYLAGDLNELQKQQFCRQCEVLSLRLRPTVVAGDPVMFLIDENCRAVGPSMHLRILTFAKVEMDGVVVREDASGCSQMSGLGSGGSSGNGVSAPAPGKHEIQISSQVELRRGPFDSIDPKDLLSSTEQKVTGTFAVVPPSAAPQITLTNDPKLLAPIKASMVLSKFSIGIREPRALQGRISITSLPANVGFDIFVRFNGHEAKISSLTAAKAANGDWQIGGSLSGITAANKPAKIDVILRSSGKAALQTVDLNEIWDGEIIYPNIPLGVDSGR